MANKVEIKERFGLKLGQVLVSEWGYEASIFDFYEVVGFTNTMVKVAKLNKRDAGVDSDYPMYYGRVVVPMTGEGRFAGVSLTRKPFNFSASKDPRYTGISINSYASAYPWNGEACDEYNAH